MTHNAMLQIMHKVHEEYDDWETNKMAYDYANELWSAAHQCIVNKDQIHQDMLPEYTFKILHETKSLSKCLTDKFRKLVISNHARGLTTSETIDWILKEDSQKNETPFYLFKYENVCGYDKIKEYLLIRISYLKPTHPRWPHKKYGEHWRTERQQYLNAINDMPYSQIKEQIAALSEHYEQLHTQFKQTENPNDIEKLHKCKIQTLAAINLLARTTETNIYLGTINSQSTAKALTAPQENQKEIQLTTTKKEQK